MLCYAQQQACGVNALCRTASMNARGYPGDACEELHGSRLLCVRQARGSRLLCVRQARGSRLLCVRQARGGA
jgi:hypothetical protein